MAERFDRSPFSEYVVFENLPLYFHRPPESITVVVDVVEVLPSEMGALGNELVGSYNLGEPFAYHFCLEPFIPLRRQVDRD